MAIKLEVKPYEEGKGLRYPFDRAFDSEQNNEYEYSDFLKIRIIEYVASPENSFNGNGFNIPSAEERIQNNRLLEHPLETILLPIPQSIQDSNGVRWGEDSLNPFAARGIQAASNIMESDVPGAIETAKNALQTLGTDLYPNRGLANLFFGSKIVNALGGNTSFEGLIARTSGNVLNPNLELLFNGVTLRSFSFDFDLTPRHESEATQIKKIIRAFKKHMSAKSGPDSSRSGGLFIGSPDIFQISYHTVKARAGDTGDHHEYLNRFKPMALLNMSVNYTGSGTYATYSDTSPVHYKLNLQFQELDPIYAEDYVTAEGKKGVGY